MKTSTQTDYHASIQVHTSAHKAADAISNVRAWWAKKFEGSAKELNDIFIVRFGETFVRFKITEMIPDKKIVWAVQDCYLHWLKDKTEWNHTSVLWEISKNKNLTEIGMTHIGLKPGVECFNDCEKGWDQHVKGSLFRLLTEGRGNPE
jgi:hypothetical protein